MLSNPIGRQKVRMVGFTLVELLVVIAIIGILVALLLPAIQAAREAGRRTACANQMRQMSLALQNHESSRKIFPSGGVEPWPYIEDYAAGGKPFAAPKQGLSWAFQILPYLEQDAVHNLVDSNQLNNTRVDLYVCPSRRGPTQHSETGRWLMDYAALVGSPPRSAAGDPNGSLRWVPINSQAQYDTKLESGQICSVALLFGGTTIHLDAGANLPKYTGENRKLFATQGVIVRSSYFAEGSFRHDFGLPGPTKFKHITDGASNTAVLCEKRIPADRYDGLEANGILRADDDAGWSDGWDFDTLRLAYCQPTPDTGTFSAAASGGNQMASGSAHTSVFYCAFADGSVHGINYDIDVETFNLLANKSDGEIIDYDF